MRIRAALFCFALTAVFLAVLAHARAEWCFSRIDDSVVLRDGYRWQHRTVDGRKCWFVGNRILPKEDLIWMYKSEDYDSDVIVKERKVYDLDESGRLKLRDTTRPYLE